MKQLNSVRVFSLALLALAYSLPIYAEDATSESESTDNVEQTYTPVTSVDSLYDGMEFVFYKDVVKWQQNSYTYYDIGPYIFDACTDRTTYVDYDASCHYDIDNGSYIYSYNAKVLDSGKIVYVDLEDSNLGTEKVDTPIIFKLEKADNGWYIYDVSNQKYVAISTSSYYVGWDDNPKHTFTIKYSNNKWLIYDQSVTGLYAYKYLISRIKGRNRMRIDAGQTSYSVSNTSDSYGSKWDLDLQIAKVDDMSAYKTPDKPTFAVSDTDGKVHIQVAEGNYIYYYEDFSIKPTDTESGNYDNVTWTVVKSNEYDYTVPDLSGYSSYTLLVKAVNPISLKESEITQIALVSGDLSIVNEITQQPCNLPNGVYNLMGVKIDKDVNSLSPGIYIIKSDNKIEKRIVK